MRRASSVSGPGSTGNRKTIPRAFNRRRWIAISLGLIAIAAGAAAVFPYVRRQRGPAVPTLASLGPLAPEVADLMRQALAGVAQDPRDAQRWSRFAMAAQANGLITSARDAYAEAIALDGSDARWWYFQSLVESQLGRPETAVADVRRVIELNPTYAPAQWRLGAWLLDADDVDGAERAFARVADIEPYGTAAPIGLARVYLQRREDQRAVDVLERALARSPGDRYALQLLGTAYRRLGRVDEAEFALTVGETAEPAIEDPWLDSMLQYRRGFAARLKDATSTFLAGHIAPAITLLEQLRAEDPDNLPVLSHLGEVYVAGQRADQGVPLLEQVVARDPQRFEAFVNLAAGYLQLAELPRARAAVERAIAVDPTYGRAYETKGLILWRDGDLRGALDALKDASRYDPRDATAPLWAGMVEMNLNRPADARASFEQATRVDPTRVDAWVGIANANMALRALGPATTALARARQLDPDSPAVKKAAGILQSFGR